MKKLLLKTVALTAVLINGIDESAGQAPETLWQTTIRYSDNAGRYEVYGRPMQSRSSVSYTLASTITVLLPTGNPQLTSSDIVTSTTDYPRSLSGGFEIASRWLVTAADPNPAGYYVSFDNNIGGRYEPDFSLVAGKEYLLFTFTLASGCVPGVRLWQDSDPVIPQLDYATTIPDQGNREQFSGNYHNVGTSCGQPASLPISFGVVTAMEKNCSIHLSFSWLSQQDNKQFEIEHSVNSDNAWKTISITGNTGNNGASPYNYIHSSPVAGRNYYRIKQVDTDGRFSYSKTIDVTYNCNSNRDYLVYPNPVHRSLKVVLPDNVNKRHTIQLSTADGRVVAERIVSTGNSNDMDVSGVPAGLYYLRIVKENKVLYVEKIIKL